MKTNPTNQTLIKAMEYTNTTVAYFIVTEPRLSTEEYQNVVSRALQNQQITVTGVFGAGKLYIFYYEK